MTWRKVPLGEVAEVRLGRQRSPKNHNGSDMRPYVRAANVGWSGLRLDDVKIMNFTDAEMEVYRLQPGDLLLGEASGSPTEVGKPAIWNGEIDNCAFQNTLLRVRSRGPEPRYLLHYFRHQAETGRFAARSRGVGIFHLGRKALATLPVPLPSVEEQRRVVAILDAAETVRMKRRESRTLLDSLTESLFHDLCGAMDGSWPVVSVESLAADRPHAIRTGPFGSQLLHSEFVDSGIAVLGIDNAVQDRFAWKRLRFITEEKFSKLRRFQVHPGDVLITIMATCGRVAVVPDDIPVAINTKHLCCITLDQTRCSPLFLWAAFRFHPSLRRQLGATARGAVMPGLNMGLIRAATLPLPPITMQRRFAESVEMLDRETVHLSHHERHLDELFASLQHRAFRGEL